MWWFVLSLSESKETVVQWVKHTQKKALRQSSSNTWVFNTTTGETGHSDLGSEEIQTVRWGCTGAEQQVRCERCRAADKILKGRCGCSKSLINSRKFPLNPVCCGSEPSEPGGRSSVTPKTLEKQKTRRWRKQKQTDIYLTKLAVCVRTHASSEVKPSTWRQISVKPRGLHSSLMREATFLEGGPKQRRWNKWSRKHPVNPWIYCSWIIKAWEWENGREPLLS